MDLPSDPKTIPPGEAHWVRTYAWMLLVNGVLIALFYFLSTAFQP